MIWPVIFIVITDCAKNIIIDIFLFCVNNWCMELTERIFSQSHKIPHRALTAILRRDGFLPNNMLRDTLVLCDVSADLGELPPELRARVAPDKIAHATREFRRILREYLLKNKKVFLTQKADVLDSLPEMEQLFGTDCIVEYRNDVEMDDVNGNTFVEDWSGSYGVVVKLSFPRINAAYALKLFRNCSREDTKCGHGPMFEIPTAFCASHAQPHDYEHVYMASLSLRCPYMLSKWGGDYPDYQQMNLKENMIYSMSLIEVKPWNLRGGKCIDFGKTYKTTYGRLTYRGRKMYRQLSDAVRHRDVDKLDAIAGAARGRFERQELRDAMRAIDYMQYVYSNPVLRKIRHEYLCR